MIATVITLVLCIGVFIFVFIGVKRQGTKQDELFDKIKEKAKLDVEIGTVE